MARVVICGGSGKVAQLLLPMLANDPIAFARVYPLVRSQDRMEHLDGHSEVVQPRLFDLEYASTQQMASLLREADVDTVIWSAGAGGKGGHERTKAVDLDAAKRMIDATASVRGRRFIMVSALSSRERADRAAWWDDEDFAQFQKSQDAISFYHECKVAADKHLMATKDISWTIVRPGRLTEAPATGRVQAGKIHIAGQAITRADVAQVILAILQHDRLHTAGLNIDILNGPENTARPISEAIARVVREQETTL
ncbi:hypothetical protein PYCC9005_002092 [Savitreella phatthalungensis]